MPSRIISADRVARLLAGCNALILAIEVKLGELERQARTSEPGVFRNIALEPAFDSLVRDIQLFIACACAQPTQMAARLDSLAERFPTPTLHALLVAAAREIRGEDA